MKRFIARWGWRALNAMGVTIEDMEPNRRTVSIDDVVERGRAMGQHAEHAAERQREQRLFAACRTPHEFLALLSALEAGRGIATAITNGFRIREPKGLQ